MKELEFIYRRRSVRRFTDEPVPEDHILEMVKAATYAPSGSNVQNWQFVVITDKAKIAAIAELVGAKNAALVEVLTSERGKNFLRTKAAYHTVFKNAPALVLVYAGPYETVAELLLADGVMTREEIEVYARPYPRIQSVAAAMENLLLAAAALGYGTCWMTGPTYAAEEITDYIGRDKIKAGYHLAAISPLGVPADTGANPPRKPVNEVLTLIK